VEAAAMGTRLNFTAFTSEYAGEVQIRQAIERAIMEVRRLEELIATWREDSEVSRINRSAGRAPVRVGADTFGLIDKSLGMSAKSAGIFDITFEVMHGLWKFEEGADAGVVPTAAAVAERRKLIDYRHVVLDKESSTVYLERPESKLGLGAIARGYALDKAARVLLDGGIHNFLAQAGSDLYVHGHHADGSPWMAGIRDPRGSEGAYFAMMPVVDHAFSTASDNERSYVVGGKRYHPILDPRSGYPATASRSVTIWAKDALTAAALGDTVFVLGPQRGLELVESTDEAGAVIVDSENKVWVSKRLEGKIKIERPPSDGV
jgi:FAD:protein FMN transferase